MQVSLMKINLVIAHMHILVPWQEPTVAKMHMELLIYLMRVHEAILSQK